MSTDKKISYREKNSVLWNERGGRGYFLDGENGNGPCEYEVIWF